MYISSRVKTTENYIQCQERADRDTLDDATISTSECEVPRQIAATHFSHIAIQPTPAISTAAEAQLAEGVKDAITRRLHCKAILTIITDEDENVLEVAGSIHTRGRY